MTYRNSKTPVAKEAAAVNEVPALVKLAYLLIGCASLVYFLLQRSNGGSFVAAANEASLGLVYGVAGLTVVFGIVVVAASFRRP